MTRALDDAELNAATARAATVLDTSQEVIVAAGDDRRVDLADALTRLGFGPLAGYLEDVDGFLLRRHDLVQRGNRVTVYEFANLSWDGAQHGTCVIDVRESVERARGHAPDQLHIPLAELRRRLDEVPVVQHVVVYCSNGWRSSVAASLLRRLGRSDVSDLLGGYAAWQTIHRTAHA